MWSGFAACVNQTRVAAGKSTLGFINPLIYQLGASANYALDFHDIADNSTNLFYPATTGYDNATGWGTINVGLFADLVNGGPVTAAPGTQTAIYQINCGSSAAVGTFSADNYYTGGNGDPFPQSIDTTGVANAAPMAVYQSLRWGNFSYTLPNLTAGATYTVRLHFAEDHYILANQRVFNVAINAATVLSRFDIVAAVGANKAVVKEFTTTADSNGKIALNFVSVTDYPQVNGIEVLTSSGAGSGPTLPSAPTGLTATAGNAQATLAWTAVTGATSYKVYRSTTNGSGYALVGTSAAVSIVDTGLTNGTTYYYVVTALNAAGESANSNQASATPTAPVTIPNAPTGLTATAGNAQVTLTWNASTGATSYKVYRSTTNGSGYALVSTSATTGFVNTGLTNGTTYYYVVTALNTAGESANSNQASATPTAPSNSSTLYQIDSGSSTAVGTFSADNYYTGGNGDTFPQSIDTTGVANAAPMAVYQSLRWGNFSYTLPNLTAGATYTVRLHFAEDHYLYAGQRVFNVASNGTTVLTNLDIVAAVGPNKALVKEFSTTADSSGKIFLNFISVTDYAQVNGIEVFGNSAPTAPSAPTNLTATAGNAQVTLAWSTVTGATSYKVYRSTTSGGGYALVSTSTANGLVDTGLTNGTTYYYVVTALNTAGESANSNQASATPSSPTLTAVYQIDAGGGAVGTFSADKYYSGGDYGSFSQTIDTTGVANAAPMAVYQSVRFGNFNYTLPSLTAGATYTVRLHFAESYFTSTGKRVFNVAINGATALGNFDVFAAVGVNKALVRDFTATADGNGKIVITFTSLVDNAIVNGIEVLTSSGAGSGPTLPSAPTGLTATAGNAQATLAWTAVTGATSYKVYRSTTNGSGYALVGTSAAVSIVDTGLTNGTTYYYVVTALNAAGESANSNQASATPTAPVTIPNAPTGLTATAGNAQVTLTWNASTGATSYKVYRSTTNGSGYALVSTSATTGFVNTGLTNGTTYYYVVTALNTAGESANSNQASATPTAPSNSPALTAVYQIDAGGGAVGTFIADTYYSAGDYGSFSQTIDTTGVANAAPAAVYQSVRFGNFNYSLPNLTAGATYTVRLHFAESYFTSAGKRVFNVAINGATVLSNFDILATVGTNKAVVKDFTATADGNGKIVITFTSLVDNALVNGVEILR